MSFTEFINIIVQSFNNFFNFFIKFYETIIKDNWIKFLIFSLILFIIIDLLDYITDIGFNIFEFNIKNNELKDKENKRLSPTYSKVKNLKELEDYNWLEDEDE